ncbi:MAG: histidine--tRNA ligase [Clostridia bacterium]|nr:histidine--tRNA ligase [Clostridia bacterium]
MEMKAPRGTHDIMPDQSGAWQIVEEMIRRRCRSNGFDEIRTPIFEQTGVFARGVGDTTDIVQKEMYTFEDKGGRSMTLRPENTAGVVRAFLEHRLYAGPMPVKLYYLSAPMFRYENPQSGRYRQFHQFGVEVFGAPDASCDAEVIALAWGLLKDLGVEKLALHINSIGCPKCRAAYQEMLKAHFNAHLDELCETCHDRLERNPLRILDCKIDADKPFMKEAPHIIDHLCEECQTHLENLKKYLATAGIPYTIDPMIVRGLDCYTKTVFEIVSEDIGAQGTVCGGGRYDGLMRLMGGPELPGVGFAFGMERLLMVMDALGIMPEDDNTTDVYIASMPEEEARQAAFRLCLAMRAEGLRADVDHVQRSLKAQMKYAGKSNVHLMIVIGQDELETGKITVRDMRTKEERQTTMDAAVETVLNMAEGEE